MKEYQIQRFTYNGFMGNTQPGLAKYTAKFNSWTNDPGVAKMDCSDGKQRLIPTFAIIDYKKDDFPQQDYSKKVLFGQPSKA